MFDKDGGGSISIDEVKQILSFGQNLDDAAVNLIIKQVDENGDGEISFDEASDRHALCEETPNSIHLGRLLAEESPEGIS